MTDSPELKEARAEVDAAIKKFVIVSAENHGNEVPYVLGWAAHAEFISSENANSRASASMVIVPDDQLVSTSLGLFHLGMEAFNIQQKH